ncbi:hypothetical protein [Micromonospora haikouensis]|uniref:hypothetical protein n=1 Tax=Micromonospora haikouensis TaxID=686309 RepID=UPI003D75BDE2
MSRRWWVRLGGGATAALTVVVGVATNQVLNDGRWNWPWLVSALLIALSTGVVAQWLGRTPDSELELSAVTLTQTGSWQDSWVDSCAVLDLKLRNIGGQPAILHRATFHVHDAICLSPYDLVGFLPYEEMFLRGALIASNTYDLSLPDPEQAAGSRHTLDLAQAIEPAGTDCFLIRLGIPPTQDTLIYLLRFDIHYNTRRTLTSPAIAIAHPPGSTLVSPDEIRADLHRFHEAVREVRAALDVELVSRGLAPPDWDNHPPTGRTDLPANLLAVDGNGLPFSMAGTYEVNDAFWNPAQALTQRLHDIRAYCTRVVRIIKDADISHDSLPFIRAEAQAILDELPALEAEFNVTQAA